MAEIASRWESERANWIRSQRWLDKQAAARRAALLTKRARQLNRDRAGRGDSIHTDADLPGLFHRWVHHDDATTSFLGTVAFVMVFGITLPFWLGIAWAVGGVSHWLWEQVADKHRVRVWAYPVIAAVVGAVFVAYRQLGFDSWLIAQLAGALEVGTAGLIAPAVLSTWYATGIITWAEIQVVLGLLYGGWLAWSWGWAAPAIRRDVSNRSSKRANGKSQSKTVQMISAMKPAEPKAPATKQKAVSRPARAVNEEPNSNDPLKIISRPRMGGKTND